MTIDAKLAGARPANEVLVWARSLVDPGLREAVDTLPDSIRRIAGYHLGCWDADGTPTGGRAGGKAFRPAVALLAVRAAGGDPVLARPAAGDALLALALDVLAASGHAASPTAVATLRAAVCALLEGQHADVTFEDRTDVDLPGCLRMAAGKSGALLGAAAALGGSFGGADPPRAALLRQFGEQLGVAFQLTDDLLGIWGDPAVTGKPVHSDLRRRKKSLPLVAALCSGTPAGAELAALYHREPPLTDQELAHAAELVDWAGGRVWCRRRAEQTLAESLRALRAALDPGPATTELAGLAELAVRRDH